MSDAYQQYARNVSDIIRSGAARQAETQRANGQIWGQTIANLGQTVAHTIEGVQQQHAAQAQEQQLRELFASGNPSAGDIISVMGPTKGIPIINGLAALRGKQEPAPDPQKQFEQTQKVLQNVLRGMDALPEGIRAESYPTVRSNLIQRGVITEKDAPETYDPSWWASTVNYGNAPKAETPPKMERVETVGPDGKAVTQFVTPTEGQTFERPAATATSASNPTEASLALAAANGDKAAEDALKRMRGQRVAAAGGGSGSGGAVVMSPEAVDTAAHRAMLFGPSSIPTRFNDNDKKTILNREAAINKAIGNTPAVAAMRSAVQKADQGALNKITAQAAAAEAFENKALQQADLVKSLSAKVGRTNYPLINGVLVSGKAALGNTPAHLLANALLTYTSEYAKLIEGSAGSAAGSSDASRRAAASLVSTALAKGTLNATVDQMNNEMGMTRNGYRTTISDITERMGGAPASQAAAPTVAPAPTATGGDWIDAGNGIRIRKQ